MLLEWTTPVVGEEPEVWLPLVDTFRTFYFNEFTDLKDELETIKTNFIFV